MYMYVISGELSDIMAAKGFLMSTVMSRRSGPELLSVLRFTRVNDS